MAKKKTAKSMAKKSPVSKKTAPRRKSKSPVRAAPAVKAKGKAASAPKKGSGLRSTAARVIAKAKAAVGLADENDLVEIIKKDHEQLKDLIKIMKNSDLEMSEREAAFGEFAPALLAHARPEELTLYTSMKSDSELREDGFEGDVEHGLADQMVEEIKRTQDQDLLGARIKVLAEMVEHHIKEEEDDMLPEYQSSSDVETRIELGQRFLTLKQEIMAAGADDAPPEASIEQNSTQVI